MSGFGYIHNSSQQGQFIVGLGIFNGICCKIQNFSSFRHKQFPLWTLLSLAKPQPVFEVFPKVFGLNLAHLVQCVAWLLLSSYHRRQFLISLVFLMLSNNLPKTNCFIVNIILYNFYYTFCSIYATLSKPYLNFSKPHM